MCNLIINQVAPSQPWDSAYDEALTSMTSLHLWWEPGFDGGLTQTFLIKYKRLHDVDWMMVSVNDNGDHVMSYRNKSGCKKRLRKFDKYLCYR